MKNNLKKMLSVLMVIVMVLSLAACGGKTETAAPADGAAARTDIIIGVAAEPSSLDPCMSAGASISENMALCLTTLDENMMPQPEIAKSWEPSEDGLEYVFEIDTSIKFANGDNITVTVKRMVDEKGKEMESCPHPQQVFYVDLGVELSEFDILRRQEEEKIALE